MMPVFMESDLIMPTPKHFVIRHDFASLEALPNYVWHTGYSVEKVPHRYKEIMEGSKWVSYAYKSTDYSGDRLRSVTGFYCCVTPHAYGRIPLSPSALRRYDLHSPTTAWLIEGKPDGTPLKHRVLVPSIDWFFDTPKFHQQAITPISKEEYDRICKYVRQHQAPPDAIPVFAREPETEQEVLAIFVASHKRLGIKRILRVQLAFPDVTVELEGVAEPVQLELELYGQSYISHGHPSNRKIGVLCWLNDDPTEKGERVADRVYKVCELRELLKHKWKIEW